MEIGMFSGGPRVVMRHHYSVTRVVKPRKNTKSVMLQETRPGTNDIHTFRDEFMNALNKPNYQSDRIPKSSMYRVDNKYGIYVGIVKITLFA